MDLLKRLAALALAPLALACLLAWVLFEGLAPRCELCRRRGAYYELFARRVCERCWGALRTG